jgi:hypothetical protein
MRNPTPFFAALKPLLFGRPPRQGSTPFCHSSSAAASQALCRLRDTFGFLIPDTLLARQECGPNSRDRVFSSLITFWAFLSQVLCPDAPCRDAVRKVQAWWALQALPPLEGVSASTSAYCQARLRLSFKKLQAIHEHIAQRLERNVPGAALWYARVVKVVDGTNVSMPDTSSNQQAWPQPSSQKPGCGFPMMKLVGLFSLASGALLKIAQGTLHVHESVLFRQLWKELEAGDVLLSDRGFCSYFALAALRTRLVDGVMRLHQARKINSRRGRCLGPGDRLVQWIKPGQRTSAWSPEEFAALPASMTLRLIRLEVPLKGFRTRQIFLITSLLDALAYPAEAICQLYMQRWSVELHFREIKTILRLDVLRCKTPAMIQREVLLHLIAYNLVRALMQQAALSYQLDLSRLSFKGTLDTLRHFADVLHATEGQPRKQAALLDHMMLLIAKDQVPLRPFRNEPRAKKRRAKNYHLLTKPRHQMRVPAHRNRPRQIILNER